MMARVCPNVGSRLECSESVDQDMNSHCACILRFEGNGTLQATRVYVVTIKQVESTLLVDFATKSPQDKYSNVLEAIKRLSAHKFGPHSDPGGGSMDDALWRTFTCNTFADGDTRQSSLKPVFQQSKEYSEILFILRDRVILPSTSLTSRCMRRYVAEVIGEISGRCFVTTEEGYIGLAPLTAKPEDSIFVFLGCRPPLHLQPNEDGYYRVVGECSLHGSMEGLAGTSE